MAFDSTLTHATIIAGGLGSRAHVMTGDRIPKALLPVAGKPILFRQREVLAREGVKDVTILAGHRIGPPTMFASVLQAVQFITARAPGVLPP